MRAGKLDRRVTIRRFVEVGRDAFNAPVLDWADVATVWAQQRPIRGADRFAERVAAEQVAGTAVLTFHLRYRGDLSIKDRIIHDGKVFEIIAPPREIGRRVVMEVDAVARAS